MSSFVENLWSSIFTPGPTPTLLIATNATFAALQLLLFILLVATYSIHFVILSLISGCLWYAINWFAAELKVVQEQQEREKKDKEKKQGQGIGAGAGTNNGDEEGADADDDRDAANESDDTEVDASSPAVGRRGRDARRAVGEAQTAGSASREVEVEDVQAAGLKHRTGTASEDATAEALGVDQGDNEGNQRRPSSVAGTQSSASTEDEWEKVSEYENEKDK